MKATAEEIKKLVETARRGDIAGNGLIAILGEHCADLAARLDALEATVAEIPAVKGEPAKAKGK